MAGGWLGACYAETDTGGLLGATRWWAVSTANADPTGDQTNWDNDAGSTITVYYRTGTTGGTTPSAADNVTIEVRLSSGATHTTLSTGAPPANGDSFTFNIPQCGGYELYIRADFDGVAGDYDVDSQGTAVVGNASDWKRGLYRSNALFSNMVHDGYPAGTTHAYGPAGDETIGVTATHTAPTTATEGDIRIDATDGTVQQVAGAVLNYTGTSTTGTFTANNSFDDAAKTYGARALPIGNAFITPDSGAVLWTVFVDNKGGPSLQQDGDNVYAPNLFDVDPRITAAAPTFGETIYNRGELATVDIASITNARGESLTRSVSFILADSLGATQATIADVGANYDIDYTIGATDTATNDAIGDTWQIRTNQADVDTQPFQDIYAVSSLYLVDVHTQLEGTLNKDDFPTDDANEDHAAVILGDVVFTWVHVEGVRNDGTEIDTSGSAVTLTIKNPSGGIVTTYSLDTGADGWTGRVDEEPTTPAGDWTYEGAVSFAGNSGTDIETITYITPLTSNLFVVLAGPTLYKPGQSHRWYIRTEVDNVATAPQNLPTWRLFSATGAVLASGNFKNATDDTETINGAVYYVTTADLGDPSVGRYTLWAEAQLNGNDIKAQDGFRVTGNTDYNPVASKLGAIGPP